MIGHQSDTLQAHCSGYRWNRPLLLAWYFLFGALHEAAHISVALLIGLTDVAALIEQGPLAPQLVRAFLQRQCVVPLIYEDPFAIAVVRNAGWIASLVLAFWVHLITRERAGTENREIKWAVSITAFEAISTDLLGFGVVPMFIGENGTPAMRNTITFLCGNFGIILLNSAWSETPQGKKRSLDVLEKMVNITMMRGAQSGGVVTFVNRSKEHKDQLIGIRSRVVNSKRSDLSKRVRAKIEKDALRSRVSSMCGGPCEPDDIVKTYSGHTRFATSSIASFDGTHPHQWSPPRLRRVYRFDKMTQTQSPKAEPILVENYITHNGDLDFYAVGGVNYGLEIVQKWLEFATGFEAPSVVDSAAIAGIVDLLHTQGCFTLSVRYAVCLGMKASKMTDSFADTALPTIQDYSRIAAFFEAALDDLLEKTGHTLDYISSMPEEREFLESMVLPMLELEVCEDGAIVPFAPYLTDEEEGAGLSNFVRVVVDAFFDNDLFYTTKTFMTNATGSFGLCVTSSLSAHRQLCLAARGQTASVAFYPKKGIICYGSEQAAVKAGLAIKTPGGDLPCDPYNMNDKPLRLDLSDLHGEVCLIDWGWKGSMEPAISPPNRHLPCYRLMNETVNIVLFEESKGMQLPVALHQRMTLLEAPHEFVKQLPPDYDDPVLQDIRDIPKVCRAIQDDWRGFRQDNMSLNRLTAWNFTNRLQKRMRDIKSESIERQPGSVDILLTGCEVSLWLAEQFAADLTKAFPKLGVKAISSNKLLGLFGQDMSVPAIGFPWSQKTYDLKGAIIIIVSHSGGTFAPLACSNLLQSMSENLFCITSEWDTQVAKQLRSMHSTEKDHFANSRIFTTDVGLRPAEPCSVSVAATQQLLTNLFEHTCIVLLSNPHYRDVSGALITESDLQVLERCNNENIGALESIVGVDSDGSKLQGGMTKTEKELRDLGNIWAKHVLENVKAYIMCFLYIFGTVTAGYPLVTGLATLFGLQSDQLFYLTRFIDSAIYFWCPQIFIMIIRLIERRNLRHRMVGRTVVIGDCPWVAQSAEAFLSKMFATSYSIAGCNVLSGNPADHLVHRHTHRVVRGSLLICGRPDGRLSALTSLETSICLSINQASSIQSIGGTCESVTIGHNPFKLPLSSKAVFLDRARPMFLCERLLGEKDLDSFLEKRRSNKGPRTVQDGSNKLSQRSLSQRSLRTSELSELENWSLKRSESENLRRPVRDTTRSAATLQGAYHNLAKEAARGTGDVKGVVVDHVDNKDTLDELIAEAIEERKRNANLRKIFKDMDVNGNGKIEADEFVANYYKVDSSLSEEQVRKIFDEADTDSSGFMTYEKFVRIAEMPELQKLRVLQAINRPRCLLQVEPSTEAYFGENLRKDAPASVGVFGLEKSQHFAMDLYESRIASMQRFVAMTVMFHEMGRIVRDFFSRISFGYLGYRFDRTHSIMRIATTASPVSGADVRERIHRLQLWMKAKRSIEVISFAWHRHNKQAKTYPTLHGHGDPLLKAATKGEAEILQQSALQDLTAKVSNDTVGQGDPLFRR